MPTLDNPAYEAFAQALARGASVREANAEAGLTPQRPCRLNRRAERPDIVARVTELRWGQDVELLAIYDKLVDLAEKAGRLDSGAGMMAAKAMLAEAARLKQSVIRSPAATTAPVPAAPFPTPPDLSKEEWLAAFARKV